MVSSTLDSTQRPANGGIPRLALGVALPVADLAILYALWWVSDRLGQIGPLDRATFGWTVLAPLWVSVPVVAGLAWRRLPDRTSLTASLSFGAVAAASAPVLFMQSVVSPVCEFGATKAPSDWLLPSVLVGLVFGGGLAASGLATTRTFRQERPWRALIVGVTGGLVVAFAAILVAVVALVGPGCQRPPIAP